MRSFRQRPCRPGQQNKSQSLVLTEGTRCRAPDRRSSQRKNQGHETVCSKFFFLCNRHDSSCNQRSPSTRPAPTPILGGVLCHSVRDMCEVWLGGVPGFLTGASTGGLSSRNSKSLLQPSVATAATGPIPASLPCTYSNVTYHEPTVM